MSGLLEGVMEVLISLCNRGAFVVCAGDALSDIDYYYIDDQLVITRNATTTNECTPSLATQATLSNAPSYKTRKQSV